MIRKVEMERFTVTSSKLFDVVVAAIKASIGHPNTIVVFPSPCFGEDSSACSPALSQSDRHPGARPVPPP